MADLRYNGESVNAGVSSLYNICDKFPSIAASVKSATNKLISAKGFNQCVSGVSSNTFSAVVDNCQTECGELARNIRQKQVDILGYSQDDKDIQSFLDEINNSEYKALDLSSIESHISFGRKAANFFKGAGSTAVEFGLGLGEGLAKFGETAYDLGDIALTGAKSLFASKDEVNQMWEECKARVSTEHVKSYFDDLYSENVFLSDVKNNAFGGDTGREIGKGLGYAAGMVGLNALTGGLASPGVGLVGFGAKAGQLAATAAVMGFSKHTEEAWNDGATVSGGLKYGAAAGAWEGVQWYLGAKINAIGGAAQAGQIFRGGLGAVGARIGLSSADAGLEGVVNPALKTLYKDYGFDSFGENYKAAFLEAGGAANIFKNAAMGAIGATFGEAIEAGKALATRGTPVASTPNLEGSSEVVAREKAIYAFKEKYPDIVKKYGEDFVDSIPTSELRRLNLLENGGATSQAAKLLGVDISAIDGRGLIDTTGYKDDIAKWLTDFGYSGDIDAMADKMAAQLFASNNVSKIRANNMAISGDLSGALRLIPGGSSATRGMRNINTMSKLFRSLETYSDTSSTRQVYFDLYKDLVSRGRSSDEARDLVISSFKKSVEARGFNTATLTLPDGRNVNVHVQRNIRDSSNNKISISEFEDMITGMPDKLAATAPNDYYYYDTFNEDDLYWTLNSEYNPQGLSKPFASAMTGGSSRITIYNCCDMPESMWHELGHSFDYNHLGGSGVYSYTSEWDDAIARDLAETGEKSITSYGATNNKEDFAESVMWFLANKEYFKSKFPNRYRILERFFG